jgi:hypothetical protein
MDGWIILPVNCKQLKSHASVFKQLDKDFNDFIHFHHFYKLVQLMTEHLLLKTARKLIKMMKMFIKEMKMNCMN